MDQQAQDYDVVVLGAGPIGRNVADRAQASGIEPIGLLPTRGDFNEDLQQLGIDDLRAPLRVQLVSEDVARFMTSANEDETAA